MIPVLIILAKCCLLGALALNILIVFAGLVWYWLCPNEITEIEVESW